MKITVAENAGFCFGVDRAVNSVYELLKSRTPSKIYTLGALIHNPTITEDLNNNGVNVIDENDIDGIFAECSEKSPCTVVIRAHGVTKALYDKLDKYSKAKPFFHVLDCTCPYVKKIHNIVLENTKEDTALYLFGDPTHPEVKGIESFALGNVGIISSSDDVFIHNFAQKPTVAVSQTTQNITEWKKTQKNIKKLCTNPLIFDTICSVTEKRQNETAKLSEQVDFMVIIGGKNSSNTTKLYNISKQHNPNTVLIENASEIPFHLLKPNMSVGISAGASTPGSIIEEVKKIMSELNENIVAGATQESDTAVDENSFAAMLEDSLKTLNTGDIVKGIITSVNSNEIHVDLETKVTGIVPYSEVSDNASLKLEEEFKVGDEIEVMVSRVSDLDGVATLSKKRVDSINNWKNIVEAYNEGKVLEGKVIDIIKGGVLVLADSQKLFVPASQSGLAKDADLNTIKGTTQKVKIIDINEQRRRAVASIRVVLREERKAKEEALWSTIEEGMKFEGKVKSLTSYGAFVDLGGVDGMVHSSELSWRHIKHPSEVVSVGDTIQVYVKAVDKEAKRISLGYKTEENDPWNKFTSEYNVGDKANVKIVNMMPFGAFAEIIPGVDGLIHISQIADKKITKPADVLEIGQEVEVKITDIDYDNRKLSLSIRALIEEAKAAEEAMPEDYTPAE